MNPDTQIVWGNIPVPYVALWSSEQHSSYVRFCRYANAPAVCSLGKRGEGKPVFGKMHEERQRECVTRRLCQVCRHRPPDGRFFCLEVPAYMESGLMRYPLFTEPPVCRMCAMWSFNNCPGLQRQSLDPDFRVYEVLRSVFVQQWLKPAGDNGEIDAALEKFGRPAVGYIKLALTEFTDARAEVTLRGAA